MATWSKKTYNMVAERLGVFWQFQGDEIPQSIKMLADAFSNKFEEDNPRFDRERFYKAIFGEVTK